MTTGSHARADTYVLGVLRKWRGHARSDGEAVTVLTNFFLCHGIPESLLGTGVDWSFLDSYLRHCEDCSARRCRCFGHDLSRFLTKMSDAYGG